MAVGLFALVGDLPDDGYFIVSGVGNQGIVEPSPLPLDEPGSVAADDERDLLERLCSRLLHCALSTPETDSRAPSPFWLPCSVTVPGCPASSPWCPRRVPLHLGTSRVSIFGIRSSRGVFAPWRVVG